LNTVSKERWKERSDGETRKRSMQLLDEFKETIGYWVLKEEALDLPQWRTCFEKSMDLS